LAIPIGISGTGVPPGATQAEAHGYKKNSLVESIMIFTSSQPDYSTESQAELGENLPFPSRSLGTSIEGGFREAPAPTNP
jgi:hypothetical protein